MLTEGDRCTATVWPWPYMNAWRLFPPPVPCRDHRRTLPHQRRNRHHRRTRRYCRWCTATSPVPRTATGHRRRAAEAELLLGYAVSAWPNRWSGRPRRSAWATSSTPVPRRLAGRARRRSRRRCRPSSVTDSPITWPTMRPHFPAECLQRGSNSRTRRETAASVSRLTSRNAATRTASASHFPRLLARLEALDSETGDLAGQVARGGHGVRGQGRRRILAGDRWRMSEELLARDVDRLFTSFFMLASFCATAERDVDVRGVVARGFADDPDDLEVRGSRGAAAVADGDRGSDRQLVLRRVGGVEQRDVGGRVRALVRVRPGAEFARAERAEFSPVLMSTPSTPNAVGGEVGAEALAAA